jgi:hypothetical protein
MKQLTFALLVVLSINAIAQKKTKAAKDTTKTDTTKSGKHLGPLFKHDTMLVFTIVANMKPLLRDRGDKPIDHLAVLKYARKKKAPIDIPIKIKVRGNFRRQTANCEFPPLLIDIDKQKKKNSVFDYQNHLKLITHCVNEEYIFQEYMVYKIYNLLTDYSFKARLARVTYQDSAAKRPTETKMAFLLEDETDLAKRNSLKMYELKQLRAEQLDSLAMARLSVFEYLIGNTDWSVPFLHNIKLLTNGVSLPVPVPYDFDHSGIVAAKYAAPSEALPIISVRERLYRGIAYPLPIFEQVFAQFRTLRPQIYALYENNSLLQPNYVKKTVKYLDEFYEVINNPKAVKREFVDVGTENQAGGAVIKGLK